MLFARRVIAQALLAIALSLPAAQVKATGAETPRAPRTCLVSVQNPFGRRAVKQSRREIEKALRQAGFKVLSLSAFRKVARRAHLSQRRWQEAEKIAPVAAKLRLDTAILATVKRQGGSYQLRLEAVDPATGDIWTHALVRLRRARPLQVQAQECVDEIVLSLKKIPDYNAPWASSQDPSNALEANAAPTNDLASGSSTSVDNGDFDSGGFASQGFDSSDFSAIDPDTPLGGIEVEWGGRVRLEHFSYIKPLDDKTNARDAFDLVLRTRAKKQKLQAVGSLMVRQDLSDPGRNRLEAKEAYVQLNLDPLEIRAGRSLLSWGSMSLLNPSDLLNPVDLREPLFPEKLGVWVLRTRLIFGPIALEAYYLPVPEQNLIPYFDKLDDDGQPVSRSRWLQAEFDEPTQSLRLRYHLADPMIPEAPWGQIQGALRASASVLGADFALAYGTLYDRLPTLHTLIVPAPPFVDVTLQRQYQRLHFISGEIEYALGKWRLASEGIAVLTADYDASDPEIPNPYMTLGLGLDYRSARLFRDNRLHLFFDFFYTRALVGELREGPLDELRFPLGIGFVARARYEIGQNLRLDLNVISSLERLDLVWNPELEYLLQDNLSIQLGLMFLLGQAEQGFFGRFRDNSVVTLQIEASF